MFALPFRRLGIFNWYSDNSLDFRFKKFHLIKSEKRANFIEQAVKRFEDNFNASSAHSTKYGKQVRYYFTLKKGRTMAKLYISESPDSRGRLYAFIDINMKDPERYGGMMKPATYKAPEPKRYIRAHLFAPNPLRGATWYGPEYMDGGKKGISTKDLRDNWFRDSFTMEGA